MDKQTWKEWERRVAAELGGTRVPVTGRHSGDVPDIDHPVLAIEVKASGRQPSRGMEKAQEQAHKAGRATGKVPVVVWVLTGGSGGPASKMYTAFTMENFKEYTRVVAAEAYLEGRRSAQATVREADGAGEAPDIQ